MASEYSTTARNAKHGNWLGRLGNWLGRLCLKAYARLISYRFQDSIEPLKLPPDFDQPIAGGQERVPLRERIQSKARASLTSSAAFLGFSIAVIAALIGADKAREALQRYKDPVYGLLPGYGGPPFSFRVLMCVGLTLSLSYFTIWIARESRRAKRRKLCRVFLGIVGTLAIILAIILAIMMFLVPAVCPSWEAMVCKKGFPMRQAYPLSGCALVVCSAFFLLISLNFYDSASGWRRDENVVFLFHTASLASASYHFGVCLALLGICQLLCILSFRGGCAATSASLVTFAVGALIEGYVAGGRRKGRPQFHNRRRGVRRHYSRLRTP
jgi:hypothetical protein